MNNNDNNFEIIEEFEIESEIPYSKTNKKIEKKRLIMLIILLILWLIIIIFVYFIFNNFLLILRLKKDIKKNRKKYNKINEEINNLNINIKNLKSQIQEIKFEISKKNMSNFNILNEIQNYEESNDELSRTIEYFFRFENED